MAEERVDGEARKTEGMEGEGEDEGLAEEEMGEVAEEKEEAEDREEVDLIRIVVVGELEGAFAVEGDAL